MTFLILLLLLKYYLCNNNKLLNNNTKYLNDVNINNVINANKENSTVFKQKRKLEDSWPIRIKVVSSQLIADTESESLEEQNPFFLESLNRAVQIIEKLIKVKKIENRVNLSNFNVSELKQKYKFDLNIIGNDIFNDCEQYDLYILIRRLKGGEGKKNQIALPKIIKQDNNKRPIVGCFYYDITYQKEEDSKTKYELYTSIFLHEFIHILGFMDNLFEFYEKKDIISDKISKRILEKEISKKIIKSEKVLKIAKLYFNCSELDGIELDNQENFDYLNNSHWEARILLGDIMTSEIYYQDQVISEFTLALLEDSGWYDVNYFTGGLMRFGKNQGCNFIDKDCMKKENDIIISSFPNEFCNLAYGTCSSGRQSRAYCFKNNNLHENDKNSYGRNWINGDYYGIQNVEYCPISYGKKILNQDEIFYSGNCKIGNNNYGNKDISFNGIQTDYTIFSNNIGEQYSSNSFCVFSSLLKIDDDNQTYKGLIRPTCYPMICSEKSLTIQMIDEFIVCPRKGGLIKIGGPFSKYKGYLLCPDYNLICTGTVICNNIFDCALNNSEIIKSDYSDYSNNIVFSSEIKTNNETDLNKYYDIQIAYELSNNGTCPIDCMQCISNKKCIKCRNMTKSEPYAYYIGVAENDNNPIICSASKPENGSYNTTKDGHIYYFNCIDNCHTCKNALICEKCSPEFYIDISKENKSCIPRIPFCNKYNKSSAFNDYQTNGGGIGYSLGEECDNNNSYFCKNLNKSECIKIDDYYINSEKYYEMENQPVPCIGECKEHFHNCKKCNMTNCLKCEPDYIINKTSKGCSERIPNCLLYNESSKFIDKENGNGYSYRDCEKCKINHYCIQNNKSICEYINPLKNNSYYDYGNGCMDKCENIFSDCLECTKEKCINCTTYPKQDGKCLKSIPNCKSHDKEHANETYIECLECNNENGFFCVDNKKTSCEKIVNKSLYYKIEDKKYSCLSKCEDKYPECETCNNTQCITCNPLHILDYDGQECLFSIEIPENDNCTVLIHDISEDINNLDFMYFMDFYFAHTLPYTKIVDHFVNENYTVTMFINSECTEDLLNQGYFKIDSTELYNTMIKESKMKRNIYLFSIFINYNYQNYYRFQDIYSLYLDPEEKCPTCLNLNYTITNKYINKISTTLGPLAANLIDSEHIDVFYEDIDLYKDYCQNLTLAKVDIPLKERKFYFYLNNYSVPIACTGINCEIEKINLEESIGVCTCKMIKNFEDILDPIIEFKNYIEEHSNKISSLSDSFGIIKCAKNGLNKKNILNNGGFYMTVIAIVSELGIYISYCICSKVINLKGGSNPPAKVKNKILLFNDWKGNQDDQPINIDEVNNNFVQSRDEDDDLLEEDITFSNKIDNSSYSIDTYIGGKGDKYSKNKKKLSEKNPRKILVLLPNKNRINYKNEEKISDIISDSEFSPLDKYKKKDKKSFCKIYWYVLSIKQHIINYFSTLKCCKITESYIPIPIRLIRSIFIFILAFLLNILFLNQNYFLEKFNYFNENYKLISVNTDEYKIKADEISDESIPIGKFFSYAFSHTIINAIIVFAILLVVQFIIGVIFFSLRKSVINVIKRNDLDGIQDLVLKTRIKYIIFFIISMVLLFIFLLSFVGFGAAYGGGFIDYFAAGIISLIILEVFPFLWSLIIALFSYIGINKGKKCCYEFSQFFIF